MTATVTTLLVTPVKGMRMHSVHEIELTATGARGNRRFFVIDERNRLLNAKLVGELHKVVADVVGERLRLTFPAGQIAEAEIARREPVTARFFSSSVGAHLLDGPWDAALSEHLGQPARIVEAEGSVDRGAGGAASLVSRASLERLAAAADEPRVDGRRFRMLIEVDGVDAHEEDDWVSSTTHVGEAIVRWSGHVGRCLTTSRDPVTGVVDLPTLDIIRSYRGEADATEPLPFGIYGAVLEPGTVRLGDVVEPAHAPAHR